MLQKWKAKTMIAEKPYMWQELLWITDLHSKKLMNGWE
jgi:hypothetical protein